MWSDELQARPYASGGMPPVQQAVPGGIIGLTGLTWLLELLGSARYSPISLDSVVDSQIGLPAAAGSNRAILDRTGRRRRRLPVGRRAASGASRVRTGDLLLAKQALFQLSYGPFSLNCRRVAGAPRSRRRRYPASPTGVSKARPAKPTARSVVAS